VFPLSGSTVGIAYPITVNFTHDVAHKELAEANMRVFVNGKLSSGAWSWQSNSTVIFRQQNFWPGHAAIVIKFTLKGVDLYESKQFRYIGRKSTNLTYVMKTARAFVAKVNAQTDRMRIYVDSHLVKNFPVSLGKKGYETRSGIKTVMEKYATRHMTSKMAGITDPNDQYDLWAPWAVRLTWSGEFVHGAPWAAYRIGKWNGSHGCTNLLADDAKWFYDNSLVGDPVVTTGTSRPMEVNNTLGGTFNVAWPAWLAHSKLKGHWPKA
jgi:lipoprotein-anchoring transpeptidase ErfK/SrfK